jgi:hypothetical protein
MRRLLQLLAFVLFTAFGVAGDAVAGAPSMSAGPDPVAATAEVAMPADWVSEFGRYVVVHAAPEDARVARRLATHADTAVPRLADALGLPAGQRIRVVVAPDDRTFATMQPGTPPTWADGTAWPLQGLVFLHAPDARRGDATALETVFDHELVHVMLGRAFAPRRVPHWLQEGSAQLLANEIRPDQTDRLGALGGADALLRLDDITGSWPADPVRAQLAYAQSAHLVAFLRNTYGQDAFHELVRRLARGQDVDASLRAATGLTAHQIDTAWRTRLASSPLWMKQVFTDTTLLGLGGFMLVAGFFAHRKRRREQLARWEREEAVQDAIYASLAGEGWGPSRPVLPPRAWVTAGTDLVVH